METTYFDSCSFFVTAPELMSAGGDRERLDRGEEVASRCQYLDRTGDRLSCQDARRSRVVSERESSSRRISAHLPSQNLDLSQRRQRWRRTAVAPPSEFSARQWGVYGTMGLATGPTRGRRGGNDHVRQPNADPHAHADAAVIGVSGTPVDDHIHAHANDHATLS